MNKPKIAIVGPGVVGQATGKAFLEKGFKVSFIGVEKSNIEKLQEEGYTAYFAGDFLNGSYQFDITFLTVPTPTHDGKIDFTPLQEASANLGKHLANNHKYHLVVVKSTVLPGTTEHLVIPIIEQYSHKKAGRDFGVCMNPEYLREKSAAEDARDPWVIVIGEYNRRSGDILDHIYQSFDGPVYRTSLKEAEMQKYVHNLFNAVKITFFNEMREIGEQIGVDPEKIFKLVSLSCEGIWNHRYGLQKKGPFSGSCLPKDTQAFLHWAQNQGWSVNVLKSAIEVNDRIIDNEIKKNGGNRKDYIAPPP